MTPSIAKAEAGSLAGYARPGLTLLLAAVLAGNGTWMLVAPDGWAARIPAQGLPDGAGHLIRDVGIAYLTCGLGCVLAPAWRGAGTALLVLSTVFLAAHGGLHLWEAAAGLVPLHDLAADAPGVLGPALLGGLLALWQHAAERREVV